MLLLIALIGERFTARLTKLSDSRGIFKRVIGALFILLGLMIIFGLEKKFETSLIEGGYFDVTQLENKLLKKVPESEIREEAVEPAAVPLGVDQVESASATDGTTTAPVSCSASSTDTYCTTTKAKNVTTPDTPVVAVPAQPVVPQTVSAPETVTTKPFVEIVNPAGFVNTDGVPITIGQYIGKKVILVNIMTYSCSNCQATFPYVNSWYEKYADDGLLVIGIHTPEFAFEKDIKNVTTAMQKFGITYPVVLDNEYATWNAYANRYWPHKYLIDINGRIVYDHIGEGAYAETEQQIRKALAERTEVLSL